MDLTEQYDAVIRFHGHECPGAAVGTRIAMLAVSIYGRDTQANRLVAVGETDACAADAVQVLSGCTFGKRNLLHEDNGKVAFTFWSPADGTGIRVSAKPGSDVFRSEEIWALARKVETGAATAEENARFFESQSTRIQRILTAPVDDILAVEPVTGEPPRAKKLQPFAPCDGCAEQTSAGLLHNHRGQNLCPPCHLDAHGGELPADHADHGHGHGHVHGHGHGHGHSYAHQH
ncbi:FmdE family protein [Sphaerisporangium sp. TRM90804]|uniref:FmdE family protein n=1 Tax=Sphaerisporangium sp. TRM90804 TaxID=3031113 RepID=UPI00244D1109|nr:FmdE family protein [Sphaerisporangium sp. TRM90804]MDH2428034.1 FmdE family protein [Sphaerisporangium sp. TRM90804]